jgi:ABC-type glycerol-3-phosphate transport system substrate-binding protein
MQLNDDSRISVGDISRRRFLRSLGVLAVGTTLVAACGPPGQPAAQPTSAAQPTTAAAPGQATPGNLGNKQISIEWWGRNYTPGSQNAETITSDAAVKGFRDRYPNVAISIQGGPFGPETDQKFDIAILQQHAGPDVFHTTGGDVLKYAAAGQLAPPPF